MYQPVLNPTQGGTLPASPVMLIAFGSAGEVRHG